MQQKADYDDFVTFNPEEVKLYLENAKKFVERIKKFITDEQNVKKEPDTENDIGKKDIES